MSLLEDIALARCRQSLAAYMSRIDIPGTPSLYHDESERFTAPARVLPKHQIEGARVVQLAIEGQIRRFMIFWPPGTAKSTLVSQVATSWAMGRDDYARIILTSYGSTLARKHSRRARGIARSPAFRRIFGRGVSRFAGAQGEWATDGGAEMLACGIDSGITGNRATLAIFDDPFKGRKAAESPTIRLRTREAIEDDLKTRIIEDLERGVYGSMGGIFTRWVVDDPAYWFLGEDYDGRSGFVKGTDGLDWFVLNCPAEAEREDDPLGRKPGEFIWPERFSREYWSPFKRVSRTWASLYQQRPSPAGGMIFKREWFAGKIIRPADVPKVMVRVRGYDFGATTEEEDADAPYSCGVKMGRSGEKIFVGPVWRERLSAGGVDSKIETTVKLDGRGVIVSMPQDPAQAGKDQAQRRQRIARNAGAMDVRISPEYGGKIYRADGFASECEKGNVYLIDDGTWNIDAYLDELCAFPVGKYADQVDASARACNELLEKGMVRTARTGFG